MLKVDNPTSEME